MGVFVSVFLGLLYLHIQNHAVRVSLHQLHFGGFNIFGFDQNPANDTPALGLHPEDVLVQLDCSHSLRIMACTPVLSPCENRLPSLPSCSGNACSTRDADSIHCCLDRSQ